jgi:hypothetical protein
MRKVDENLFGNVVNPNEIDVADVIYNLLTGRTVGYTSSIQTFLFAYPEI